MQSQTSSGTSIAEPAPRAQMLCLVCVALIGTGLRLLALDRPLWIDESWVLDSIRSGTWRGMFFYREWAQTTPPGVLALLRVYGSVTGAEAEAFRMVPALASVATLTLGLSLARRALGFSFALIAAVVLCVSPELLWYGTEIKQYAFDLLGATVILFFGLRYLAQPSRARAWSWFGVYGCLAPISYTLAFFLPTLLAVVALVEWQSPAPRRWPSLIPAALVAGGVTVALYLGVARPNADVPSLRAFWQAGFYDSAGVSASFYLFRLCKVLFSFMPNVLVSRTALTLLVALCVAGAFSRPSSPYLGARSWALGPLLALPVLTTVLANGAGFYPANDFRLLGFLSVNCLLLSLLGLQVVSRTLWARGRGLDLGRGPAYFALLCALGMTLAYGERSNHTAYVNEPWRGNMDVRGVVRYLHARNALQRPVFVHSALRQYFAVYGRVYPLSGSLLLGEVGWPCCIPGRSWHRPEYSSEEIAREVRDVVSRVSDSKFYAVVRSNKAAIPESSMYKAAFDAAGCAATQAWETTGIRLLFVDCASAPDGARRR